MYFFTRYFHECFADNNSDEENDNTAYTFVVVGKTPRIATVEWGASPMCDILADSVVALLMHAQSTPASIRMTSKPCNHTISSEETGDAEDSSSMEQPPSKKARGD